MRQLTQAEEEVMQVLWRLKKAFVKEIVEEFPDPKPAYNTVSTIIRILEKKGIVDYKAFGKTHQYYPLMDKEEYSQSYINRFVDQYFSGSYAQLVSFFADKEELTVKDLEKLLGELKSQDNG